MSGVARYLVTGAYGCIGAWLVRELLGDGNHVVTYDLGDDPRRLRLLLDDDQLAGVVRVRGDITDLEALERTIDEHEITRVIHLAALQVPFCRADPPLGARVNVVGTANVLEALRRRREHVGPLVYASSIAAFDPPSRQGNGEARMVATPSTIYGVYKRANEAMAKVYWQESGLASIGLRPHTVYGVGRDQGVTSAPTVAMLAAAAGRSFRIPYGARQQMQYAPDVARAFARASTSRHRGATVHNLAGHVVHVQQIVDAIRRAVPGAAEGITFVDEPLPFPASVDASSLAEVIEPPVDTPLREGVADTIERFRDLLDRGLVSPARIGDGAAAK
jgi:UDP-glucuronate 4-epimerase